MSLRCVTEDNIEVFMNAESNRLRTVTDSMAQTATIGILGYWDLSLETAAVKYEEELTTMPWIPVTKKLTLQEATTLAGEQMRAFRANGFPEMANFTRLIYRYLASVNTSRYASLQLTADRHPQYQDAINGEKLGRHHRLRSIQNSPGVTTLGKGWTHRYTYKEDAVPEMLALFEDLHMFRPEQPTNKRYWGTAGLSHGQVGKLQQGSSINLVTEPLKGYVSFDDDDAEKEVLTYVTLQDGDRRDLRSLFYSHQIEMRLFRGDRLPELENLQVSYVKNPEFSPPLFRFFLNAMKCTRQDPGIPTKLITAVVKLSGHKKSIDLTLPREMLFKIMSDYGRKKVTRQRVLNQYKLQLQKHTEKFVDVALNKKRYDDPDLHFFDCHGTSVPIEWMKSKDPAMISAMASIRDKWETTQKNKKLKARLKYDYLYSLHLADNEDLRILKEFDDDFTEEETSRLQKETDKINKDRELDRLWFGDQDNDS